jgi:hypothetical protein
MLRGIYDVLRARQGLSDALREQVMAVRDYWLGRTGLEAAMSGASGFSDQPQMPQREPSASSPRQESQGHD